MSSDTATTESSTSPANMTTATTSSSSRLDGVNNNVMEDAAQLRKRFAKRTLGDRPLSSSPKLSPVRRRSSLISFNSIEDATNSFHEDIVQPASSRRRTVPSEHEITHWSSTPLAFAILPALAGVLFTNGSAFVTDVLLLAFAAVFLNWSIRVPREWYYSAQAVRREVEPDRKRGLDEDDEEEDESESAIEEESDGTTKPSATLEDHSLDNATRKAASDQLKRQETTALLCTFVFPAIAAYLLHVIRSQLSLPSTSLVSDYNISIFLLAAEFWPARQVIRLIAARTLHLQRAASGRDDPFLDPLIDSSTNKELLDRLAALEARLNEQAAALPAGGSLQPADLASLDARIQKRLEPRLDSLERAVRRYEKRYTTLAIVSEQRFQNLETRLQDALSLAAVAAQQGQRQSTIVSTALSTATDLVLLPARMTYEILLWPYNIVDEMYQRFKVLILGPSAGRSADEYSNGHGHKKKSASKYYGTNDVKIKDDKVVREKQATRRLVR